jgi:hypothetical protein
MEDTDNSFVDITAYVDELLADEKLRPEIDRIYESMLAADRVHALLRAASGAGKAADEPDERL